MISFFANIFGYFLNFLYMNLGNFGLAIIIFSIIVKLVLLPITIKQQKTMKKTAKVQEKLKEIQEKYKNDTQKLNQETIELYKRENMSPFSGCFAAIVQIVLLFSIFYLVRSPLTYMRKVDSNVIEQYKTQIEEENDSNTAYPEISIIKQKGNEDETVYINMNFLGLDLSGVPLKDSSDIKVFVIPVLYVITTFFSMRLNSSINNKGKKEKEVLTTDGKEKDKEEQLPNPMEQANKNMMYIMPIMSISIALVAPLGLALYWLVNNILMIVERLVLKKLIKEEE